MTALDTLATEGFVVIERVLGADDVCALKAALGPHLESTPIGRNQFEGLRSRRV
jgi:hypothetical protein